MTTAVCTGFPGSGELTLLVIDKGTPGFTVGRRLEKLGWHCSDTAELSFVDVRVPVANRVGAEDTGFLAIMQHFAAERLSLATQAYATAQRCVELAVRWCRDRSTFGRPLASRQLIRHRLAEMHTRAEAARAYVHEVAGRVAAGEPVVTEVAMAKNVAVAACDHVVDQALQLHGGVRLPARRRGGAALPRRPDPRHRRRHHRDHERDHREGHGPVTTLDSAVDPSVAGLRGEPGGAAGAPRRAGRRRWTRPARAAARST